MQESTKNVTITSGVSHYTWKNKQNKTNTFWIPIVFVLKWPNQCEHTKVIQCTLSVRSAMIHKVMIPTIQAGMLHSKEVRNSRFKLGKCSKTALWFRIPNKQQYWDLSFFLFSDVQFVLMLRLLVGLVLFYTEKFQSNQIISAKVMWKLSTCWSLQCQEN